MIDLKTIVGVVAVAAAPLLTGMVLSGMMSGTARDAAVMLATLAWQHAGTVIRSLFPGPEIDVAPRAPAIVQTGDSATVNEVKP